MQQQDKGGKAHPDAHPPAMTVEKDIKVVMRDGVRISLCVYRPAGGQPAPALFAASPYQYEPGICRPENQRRW